MNTDDVTVEGWYWIFFFLIFFLSATNLDPDFQVQVKQILLGKKSLALDFSGASNV